MTPPNAIAPQRAAAVADTGGVPRLQAVDVASDIVAPLSFRLFPGQCVAVSGPSGAGKTRLLRLLADLDEGSGEVFLDGRPRSAFAAPDWRRAVLYQGAEPAWWLHCVLDHIAPQDRAQAIMLAARLALGADRLAADIRQLSTGERQRAALVRSLMKKPSVLLLDEPSSALDADNVARMEALLQETLQQGMAILLITHAREQAQRLAHEVLQVSRRPAP